VSAAGCQAPVPLDALVDYWAGDLLAAEADSLEEHVFACDACGRRLAGVARLAHGVAQVASRRGGLQMVLTPALVDRLARDGLRMRHYRIAPGQSVACTVGPEDDLLVTVLAADLRGVGRVDLVMSMPGHEPVRLSDAPADFANGQVIVALSGDLARTFPAMTLQTRLVAVDAGGERALAEYTFDHTPSA